MIFKKPEHIWSHWGYSIRNCSLEYFCDTKHKKFWTKKKKKCLNLIAIDYNIFTILKYLNNNTCIHTILYYHNSI